MTGFVDLEENTRHSLAPLPGSHGAADWDIGDPPPRGAGGGSPAGLNGAPCGLRWAGLMTAAAEDSAGARSGRSRGRRQRWARVRLRVNAREMLPLPNKEIRRIVYSKVVLPLQCACQSQFSTCNHE